MGMVGLIGAKRSSQIRVDAQVSCDYSSRCDSRLFCLALNDKSVKSYIEALELMFVVRRLAKYTNNPAKRQIARMPKLHFVDTGLACHLLGINSEDQLLNSQFYGNLLENLVYMECCKHAT